MGAYASSKELLRNPSNYTYTSKYICLSQSLTFIGHTLLAYSAFALPHSLTPLTFFDYDGFSDGLVPPNHPELAP